ncbi:hypothetical protein OCC_10760 [Thermococcus litoralis DSM 5473]|uniref:Alpha-galactosidase NEW3 domain-containing protein n=1 Tax=Thermococcus litoralis (strain ATCC 51850 / DSM 5473 / JCM 8560 / NS-C) TaxID=523849 RepID=H3ZR02_THELN|nr:NEW3 domain-containing protein [Thermococcus litoralis]EHR77578.1 hypothetical protein OCC_10760 [Thermococcus litoralis DSM 5473]
MKDKAKGQKLGLKLYSLFLIFMLSSTAVASQTLDVYLHIGGSVTVDGIPVEVEDISTNGKVVFLNINGTTYGLEFGESVNYSHITVYAGSIDLTEKEVHLIFENVSGLESSDSDIEISAQYPSKIVNPGEETKFTITITNNGGDGEFSLGYTSSGDLEAYYMAEGAKITRVYLEHGQSATLTFVVKAPEEEGTFEVYPIIGDTSIKLELTVTKEDSYEVYPQYLAQEVEAGESATFPLTIKSNTDLQISLKVQTPQDWEAYFTSDGKRVSELYIPAGTSMQVALVVEVPSSTPIGEYPVKAKIGEKEITFTVGVYETHAGEEGKVLLTLVDSSDGSYVSGALVEALDSTGEVVSKAYSTPNGEVQLSLPEGVYTLRISKGGYETKEIEDVEVEAGKSNDLGIEQLERLTHYFEVEVPESSKSATLGEDIVYEIRMENLGTEDDSFRLIVDGLPDTWAYRIVESPDSKTGVSQVTISSGSEKTIYLIIIPPNNAELGEYNFTLNIKSVGSGEQKSIPLETSLVGSYDMSITMTKYSYDAKLGETITISAYVYNTGTSPLTNVVLDVSVPEGWIYTVEPEKVTSIDAEGYQEFKISITVPQNIDAGDYKITLTATSDQLTDEEELRITVKSSSTSTYMGLGVTVLALVLLGVILKKYGRK